MDAAEAQAPAHRGERRHRIDDVTAVSFRQDLLAVGVVGGAFGNDRAVARDIRDANPLVPVLAQIVIERIARRSRGAARGERAGGFDLRPEMQQQVRQACRFQP
jgi:hypothetical protein